MSYSIDANTNVPVFGVAAITIKTASGSVDLGLMVETLTINFVGERIAAKDGLGTDVARVYFNRDRKVLTLNGWPFGADETAAIAIDVLFKHGALLQITASPKYPALIGFWRVSGDVQNNGSNVDRKTVSIPLEEAINQSWTGYVP